MEEQRSETYELTLWVIYASYCSHEAKSCIEKCFMYARDETEAKTLVHRWEELHPEYFVQKYVSRPNGFLNENAYITGKIQIEEESRM